MNHLSTSESVLMARVAIKIATCIKKWRCVAHAALPTYNSCLARRTFGKIVSPQNRAMPHDTRTRRHCEFLAARNSMEFWEIVAAVGEWGELAQQK
jgi:hypothetical protein